MNQSQFLAITCNSLEARERSRVQDAIGFGFCFGFSSHWLKNWHDSFKPITKRSNRNHVITFDSHLKTALKSFEVHLVVLSLSETNQTNQREADQCYGGTGESRTSCPGS